MTFKMASQPSGSVEDGTNHNSGKQKANGFNVELSVLRNGRAIVFSKHYACSVSDRAMMHGMESFYKSKLDETTSERNTPDVNIPYGRYHDSLAVLEDKGYHGATNMLHVIYPTKRPSGGTLTAENNAKI